MKFTVNIDHGFAFNMDLIAGLLRHEKNPSHTIAVMVSGETFILHAPLSEVVELLEKEGRKSPQEDKAEPSGDNGDQESKEATAR